MKLPIYQVDAFADKVFEGNPAAVCPLDAWLGDELLQAIAAENNLSETAFLVASGSDFDLRWFTPRAEVDLCGHATLASAHVVFTHLGHQGPAIAFHTRSGELRVTRQDDGMSMDFPAVASEAIAMPADLLRGLGARPAEARVAPDYIAVFESEQQVIDLEPDFSVLARLDRRGVIATAPGSEFDFVSRCFYPKIGVNEDPVTGSAHCKTAPYWARRLGRSRMIARQRSARGGTIGLEVRDDRVILTGKTVGYLRGEIAL